LAAEAEGNMKKYQEYIIGRCITEQPPEWEFKVFYVQVEERDGKRVVCGTPIDITALSDDAAVSVIEHEGCDTDPSTLADITPPEGWQLMAQHPLPDGYVPESAEVREEHQRRSIEEFYNKFPQFRRDHD
jgi:hypothetical protein